MSFVEYSEPQSCDEQFAVGPAAVRVFDNGVFILLYIPHVMPPGGGTETGLECRRVCVRLAMPRIGAARLAQAIDAALIADGRGLPELGIAEIADFAIRPH